MCNPGRPYLSLRNAGVGACSPTISYGIIFKDNHSQAKNSEKNLEPLGAEKNKMTLTSHETILFVYKSLSL